MSSLPPSVQAPQLVHLTIDDQPVSVPKGTNVILAARKLGIHVPHYCYHEKLSVAGNCRMCLIEMGTPKMTPDRKPVLKPDGTPEIAWIPRPQIGCATTVSEGMVIKTKSKLVQDCQKGVMEFLLINHPLDCPICDQAGECQLQEFSVEYGTGGSRFVEKKVHKPKHVELGPRVTLDDERCILCARCIRFCKEVVKDDVLGFFDRGSHSTLGCYPGKKLENNYSLNTVDICPVGALTSTDFRFKMRVWFLKESNSVCSSCSTGCNMMVGAREGKVYRFTPRRNNAVNSDWMCDEGRLNYHWINDPRRLTAPLVRSHSQERIQRNGEPATWEAALEFCRQKLSDHRGRLAILASGRCTTEELFLLKKIALHYEAPITDMIPRMGKGDNILVSADKNPNSHGARLMGMGGEPAGVNIPKIIEGMKSGKITGLFTVNECAIKAGIPIELFDKLDFLGALDILSNKTTECAQVVLPGAAHIEKTGTFINRIKRLQRFQMAFPPPGSARSDWEILKALLPSETFSNFEGLFQEMCQSIPALRNVTWNGLGDEGMTVEI